MRISPASGCSKPAMRRRQVVLPEPDGPSMAKNSPAAIARSTPSTARTAPKWRVTPAIATAAVAAAPAEETRRASSIASAAEALSAAAEDGEVVGDPAIVWHAAVGLRRALGDRRAPELDAAEIAGAVRLAALIAQELVALAGRRHRRHRAEPGGEVALQLRAQGVLEPQVGA